MLLSVRTNVSRWKSPFCADLDQHLLSLGATLVDLPWHDFELLKHDPDHFTQRGFDSFCRALVRELKANGVKGNVLIVADSTVDHLNRSRQSRPADAALRRRLSRAGMEAVVVSQCGSGFCALADWEKSFVDMVRRVLESTPSMKEAHWVLVGGWNDDDGDEWSSGGGGEVREAVDRLLSLWRVSK
jgi:hypothetical protein